MSEAKVLEQYLNEYQNKSLCVLNQKDKFDNEQIEKTLKYVKSSFSEYFSEVIPISALQALESRSHDKNIIISQKLDKFLKSLKEELQSSHAKNVSKNITDKISTYQDDVEEVLQSDLNENLALLKESNIQKVLDFIYEEIQPKAISSKEFAIKKELTYICERLVSQHEIFLNIYAELALEIDKFEKEAKEKISGLKKEFAHDLQDAYIKIEQIIDTIANNIYNHISQTTRIRYAKKKGGLLFKTDNYEAIEYKAPKIDSDLIYKELFYDDELVSKMFKKYVRSLKVIQDEVNDNNALVYDMLKQRIREWQSPYEFVRKQEDIFSDIEFANIRKFASKSYETILKPFSDEIHASYAKISSEFNHLSSAVSFNYQNATQVSVAFLEKKIEQSVNLYVDNPTKFSLYYPKLEEIKERLKISFHLYELQNMMETNNTFLHKNYDRLRDEFERIKSEKDDFVAKRKSRHYKTIQILEKLKKEI